MHYTLYNHQGEDDKEEEEEQDNIMDNITRQSKRTAVLDNKLRNASCFFCNEIIVILYLTG